MPGPCAASDPRLAHRTPALLPVPGRARDPHRPRVRLAWERAVLLREAGRGARRVRAHRARPDLPAAAVRPGPRRDLESGPCRAARGVDRSGEGGGGGVKSIMVYDPTDPQDRA